MLSLQILLKEYKEIIAFIILITSFFFDYGDKFIKFNFSLNIIQIFIIFGIIIIFIKLTFDILNNLIRKVKIEKFYKNWCKFKDLLNSNKIGIKDGKLDKKYYKLRISLQKDIGYFSGDFLKRKKIEEPNYNGVFLELRNLEECVSVRNINSWEEKIKRRIPEELDCFDKMILNLFSK